MEPKDEIKARLDVADIVGGYLTLKPAGSGSFKALCPFHGESTPSFYVSKEKQIWHCFGCGKGGDLISFVMEIEGMSFPEALRHLGRQAGVEIPEFRPSKDADRKASLIALNELAATYFQAFLWRHEEAERARTYLSARGIDESLAKKFRIGCAPDRWDALKKFLLAKGFSEKQMIDAGLVKQRRNGEGVIDRFKNRLMIPLADMHGRIVGFTGRLLEEQTEKTGPKYLNSPETLIYHKSDVLFGFDLARSEIRKQDAVIIVEGNLDVVASHKADVINIVASSGTALTESQLLQLKKITGNILFAFDADNAGYNAARRGMRLAQEMGFRIHVVSIPEELGKDPDEVVQKNKQAWKQVATNPVHVMEYFFKKTIAKLDPANIDSKREAAHFLVEEIRRLNEPIEQSHWLQRLSDTIRVEVDVLKDLMKRQGSAPVPSEPAKRPAAELKPKGGEQKITSRIDQAASFLVGLALYNQEECEELVGRLAEEDLPEGIWRDIYKNIVLLYTREQNVDHTQKTLFSELRDQFQQDAKTAEIQRIDIAVMRVEQMVSSLNRAQVREELHRHLDILREASSEDHRKQLEAAIRQAEHVGDSSRVRELMEEYTKLL